MQFKCILMQLAPRYYLKHIWRDVERSIMKAVWCTLLLDRKIQFWRSSLWGKVLCKTRSEISRTQFSPPVHSILMQICWNQYCSLKNMLCNFPTTKSIFQSADCFACSGRKRMCLLCFYHLVAFSLLVCVVHSGLPWVLGTAFSCWINATPELHHSIGCTNAWNPAARHSHTLAFPVRLAIGNFTYQARQKKFAKSAGVPASGVELALSQWNKNMCAEREQISGSSFSCHLLPRPET